MPAPEVKIDADTLKNQTTPISEEQSEAIADAALKELELENESPEDKKKREDAEEAETKAQEEKATEFATKAKELGLEEGASEEDINTA